jgi:hypothetical protein
MRPLCIAGFPACIASVIAVASLPPPDVSGGEPLGTAFTYQGRLDKAGKPVSGTCDFQFGLFDAATDGTQIGSTQTLAGVTVAGGLFTVVIDFGDGAFNGEARWLEIAVRCPSGSGSYATLSPRQTISAIPYALFSLAGGGSGDEYFAGTGLLLDGTTFSTNLDYFNSGLWSQAGNEISDPSTQSIGTNNSAPLWLKVDGEPALRLEPTGPGGTPNVIAGHKDNAVKDEVSGATISGGGGPGDDRNFIEGKYGTIAGGVRNRITETSDSRWCVIGGGETNETHYVGATVAGGRHNHAFGWDATVGGGAFNSAGSPDDPENKGLDAVVAGGFGNVASATASVVPGGWNNQALGEHSFAAGYYAVVKEDHPGSFVWSDGTASESDQFSSSRRNQFRIRASGGGELIKRGYDDSPAWHVLATTKGGRTGFFELDNSENASDALAVTTNGLGRAGNFLIANKTNSSPALEAQTNGGGSAIEATNTGTGKAAELAIDNSSNASDSLTCSTNGSGSAAVLSITNSENSSDALYASTTGLASAGRLEINNAQNSLATIVGNTNGAGPAAQLWINNGANSRATVEADTNGTGRAGEFTINNQNNNMFAVEGRTNGENGAGVYGHNDADTSVNQGVWGASTSDQEAAAGVLAQGSGCTGPGEPRAAALEIRNGAIRVSGAVEPAGQLHIADGWICMGSWMDDPKDCCPDPHCHKIGGFKHEDILENCLIKPDSIILLTVDGVPPDPGKARFAQVLTKEPGKAYIRTAVMGTFAPCGDPCKYTGEVDVNYLIINR